MLSFCGSAVADHATSTGHNIKRDNFEMNQMTYIVELRPWEGIDPIYESMVFKQFSLDKV